jgi:archaeal flagellin FlaB
MNSRGDASVGDLIIFIALILVGAIAAGVLIYTTQSTQQAALATAEESENELLRSAFIQEINGVDGLDSSVENLSVTIRLIGGSQPLAFRDVLVEIAKSDYDAYYRYLPPLNSTDYCATSITPQPCSQTAPQEGAGLYTIEYIKTTSKTLDGVLSSGDTVRVYVPLASPIRPEEWIRVTVFPSQGQKQHIEVHASDQFNSPIVYLYPQ